MVKVRLSSRAKLKCLDDVRKFLSVNNHKAMFEEYELVKFLYELEFFTIQVPILLWLVTKGELETRNSAPGMKTMIFTIGEAALDRDSVSLRKLCVVYIIHSLVFVLEVTNVVHERVIILADYPEFCNFYPWERLIYGDWVHMWKTIPTKKIAAHFKITTFPYVMQAWVLECLKPAYLSLLAIKIGNGYPRILRWHIVADSKEATKEVILTIYEAEYFPYGYVIPEAPELQKDYYVSAINWVDKSATYVVGEVEEANSPGFLTLTSTFQKLDKKVEEGFRHLDERIDERMHKLKARVADMEM
ncbi:hypothetical protein LIER_28738 [Lithospermum erythrorhizon]|uniref:Uncharacterized protein n=1 Tax=Lithospermum erythrorhizon TaxID=34254 RepID=A0AAV3RGR6_LITER